MLAKFSKRFGAKKQPDPEHVTSPRRWLLVLLAIAWVYIGFVLAQVLVIGLIYVLKACNVPLSDINATLFNAGAAAILYMLSIAIVIGVPWVLKKYRITIETIGLHRLPFWRDIGMTLVGVIVYIIFSSFLIYAATVLFSGFDGAQSQDVGFNSLTTRLDLLLAFATLVIIGPIAEEVLFRGFLFGTLRKIVPVWVATVATSVLFGYVHGQWNLALDTFAMSIVACLLTVKSKSLWPAIILHMIKNGIAFYVLYVLH